MFSCSLCESKNSDEWLYTSKFCSKCKKIKHYLSIYSDRVYEILDEVLSRTEDKQNNKINQEIKKEIENKKYNLRNKISKTETDESYIKPKK